tara:strand:+ start:416 stop:673 length:258 start_codon:yes stop_codon:yes gene_type:complete
MLDKIDELFETVHNQSGQQLKVDKILNVLSEGDEIESKASEKIRTHLMNPMYADQTIVTVFKNIDFIVSLSAVRTWRIKNGVKEG